MDTFDKIIAIAKGIMWALIVCFLLTLILSSCKTKYVTVPEVRTQYVTHTDTIARMSRDSILLHDSIYISQLVQGDTVYLTKEVYRQGTRWRDRIVYKTRTDTLLRSDTVTVVRPVETELTKSQRRLITIGRLTCWAAFTAIVVLLCAWWYRRKT